ncbi:MAG: DNA cytosine methyltransferase [Nannocystaceae bacterium]|nr:DNA cytosine methyltransferase [Nannocystaceae bacterium]
MQSEATRAPAAVVENVTEFRTWALYPSWCDALERLGYTLTEHVFDASWSGVPQRRKRLFLTAARGRPLLLALPVEEPKDARSIIDHDADERPGAWRDVADLPPGARARIERAAHVIPDARRFVVSYTTDNVGSTLSAPLSTITTKHQRAWVYRGPHGLERRMFSSREYARAMGFPDAYRLTGRVSDDCKLVGNAVCPPVMRAIVEQISKRG